MRRGQTGTTLIEVLVTLLIMAFGLLGLAGLQTRLQATEFESYQRTQALLLLNDIAQRVTTNRGSVTAYVTGLSTPLGVGATCATGTSTLVVQDLGDWCRALQGAAETSGGNSVGAMIGARGCIESISANEILITVAWQGMVPLTAPPASVACGKDLYDGASGSGSPCVSDRCRRAVTTMVRIGSLL